VKFGSNFFLVFVNGIEKKKRANLKLFNEVVSDHAIVWSQLVRRGGLYLQAWFGVEGDAIINVKAKRN
jgi:hypothetical protein